MLVKNDKGFSYICLGDIHFGHSNNKTANVIHSLVMMFAKHKSSFEKLDAIFINGDLFEKLLTVNSEEYLLVTRWFKTLIQFCLENDITLRLLEGTPSHDLEQGKIFLEGMGNLGLKVDFKYINSIHIEYMEKHDKYVLYIPDENDIPANKRFEIVKQLMREKGISKVDLTMIHGHFRYQLPILLPCAHSEDDYLSITRFYIHTNHIHTQSVFQRILASGSFERLKHNEEEDKGLVFAAIFSSGDMKFTFLKNELAKIFKTFKLSETPTESELMTLHEGLKKLPSTAFVRIISPSLSVNTSELNNIYDFDEIKVVAKDEGISEVRKIMHEADATEIEVVEISISKDNIVELLANELSGTFNKDELLIMQDELIGVMPNIKKLY